MEPDEPADQRVAVTPDTFIRPDVEVKVDGLTPSLCQQLGAEKAALACFYQSQSADDVADELAELSASRDEEVVGEPL
ncbi:hypothetical protein [Tessaracoccus caeni]|uniref:hypothetical protein n=1 Tax=Tessaracoccus caeni TaxID=3031239 RepID=UPI0023DAFA2B|nr:hypothetical protein [Tessaracoccus caeni]MDF1489766.1 hypothetical protein [Tessaracoccus caeni]